MVLQCRKGETRTTLWRCQRNRPQPVVCVMYSGMVPGDFVVAPQTPQLTEQMPLQLRKNPKTTLLLRRVVNKTGEKPQDLCLRDRSTALHILRGGRLAGWTLEFT